MSKFDDILNRQLPSKVSRAKYFYEFGGDDDYEYESDDIDNDDVDNDSGDDYEEDCISSGTGCEGYDDEDDIEDDDSNPYSDDDEDNDIPDIIDDIDDEDDVTTGEPEIGQLGPDAEKRVDDALDTVGTAILIGDELSQEECCEFVESVDADILVQEGYLTEKTIVKMDKNARRAQLYEVALFKVAREHNDKNYMKLQTVYKMERRLKAKLRARYHNEANRKVKEYLNRAKKSKSGILSRIAAKLSHK